jgi:flagellum-specific peptidoglycan hydrolase FlgJ
VLGGARSFSESVHNDFVPSARLNEHAAQQMDRAATRFSEASRGGTMATTADAVRAAQAAERRWGVPASIQLGQFQLESGGGRHMPRGSNNPFGMKARAGDPFVWARTREVYNGVSRYVMQKFRVFRTLDESFDEHAKLLATAGVYRRARSAPNVDAYADALTGTYATDPHYGSSLKRTIRARHLTDYDGGRNAPSEVPVRVDVHLHGGKPGDRVHVKAGSGSAPAVSHALTPVFQPVHGG